MVDSVRSFEENLLSGLRGDCLDRCLLYGSHGCRTWGSG